MKYRLKIHSKVLGTKNKKKCFIYCHFWFVFFQKQLLKNMIWNVKYMERLRKGKPKNDNLVKIFY